MLGGSPTSVMDNGDEEELIAAVRRLKMGDPATTNAQMHKLLTREGYDATIAEVKKAASKAVKRFGTQDIDVPSAQQVTQRVLTSRAGAESPAPQQAEDVIDTLAAEYGDAMATIGLAVMKNGKEVSSYMSGQVAEKIGVENGGLPNAMVMQMGVDERNAYAKERLEANAKRHEGFGRSVYGKSAFKATKQLEDTNRTGLGPERAKAVVGFITGQEPHPTRARMWVDLLLCPSGEAVLMGQCAWMTGELIGYEALMKGTNADALEGMCAFIGLADMVIGGEPEEIGAVVDALSERAERIAPALLQWIAHQPVGQDFLYGGHWKRPAKAPPTLPMSPLLHTQPAARVMNCLLRLLRLIADPTTYALYPEARPFVSACAKAVHLPATIRRLLQIIARRGSLPDEACPELAQLPAMAITALHGMSAHPHVASILREHPRAAQVLTTASSSSTARGSDTEEEEEEEALASRLRCLLQLCAGGSAACRSSTDAPLDKTECNHCGVRCYKMSTCQCARVAYCDALCQRADWKAHKSVCPVQQERKARKAAKKAAEVGNASVATQQGPRDPITGQPLKKNASGSYMVGHLAGPDGALNMWDIPGVGPTDSFDTPMRVRVPTDGMMRAVERQRQIDPNFNPMEEIERLGVVEFGRRYL